MLTDAELEEIRARAERDVRDLSDGDAPALDDHERLTRAVQAQVDRAELLGEVERLRGLLELLTAEEHEVGHGHRVAGTWDASNGPPSGGTPCARCHAFADAREALGLPRWPHTDPAWPTTRQPERPITTTCGPRCGCGAKGAARG
jgi:hypothetical protein